MAEAPLCKNHCMVYWFLQINHMLLVYSQLKRIYAAACMNGAQGIGVIITNVSPTAAVYLHFRCELQLEGILCRGGYSVNTQCSSAVIPLQSTNP